MPDHFRHNHYVPRWYQDRFLLAERKHEGFQNLGSCCGSVVLVNESTDYIAAVDLVAGSWCDSGGRLGWEQRESAMRAFAVVMDRVGAEDAVE